MAERRMFAKTIVTSDAFLDMPLSARCLYFTLGMLADDDGFVNNPKSIMRQVGASQDDLNLLLVKRFILAFDSGVIVIKHWRIHNYIQKDRYKESKYLEEKASLMVDEKGAYTFGYGMALDEEKTRKPLTEAQKKRLQAKNESQLPSSFDYKIRQAFHGYLCPICGCAMDGSNNLTKPTIQHNLPISLGGKHEIDNISVICSSCNCSIQNRQETPPYNTDKVKEIWECIGNVSGMDTQVRLGKDSIVKDSIKRENTKREKAELSSPTLEEIKEYGRSINREDIAKKFYDYYSAAGWKDTNGKTVTNWQAKYVAWCNREPKVEKVRYGNFDPKDTFEKALRRTYDNDQKV